MFEFTNTNIEGVKLITPPQFQDDRGILRKVFEKQIFLDNGIDMSAKEEIETKSSKGVLRGLHFQTQNSQGKLVRVAYGEIFDVAVDLRKGSQTFGKYFSTTLSADNNKMLYIPEGFAHGCLTLSEKSVFYYLCSQPYFPQYDSGIIWNDPDIDVDWPVHLVEDVILSEKDSNLPLLSTQQFEL